MRSVSRLDQLVRCWEALDGSLARLLPDIMGQLIRRESHSQQDGCEAEVALYLKGLLTEAGCETSLREVAPGRPNVLGVIGDASSGPTLMINCHMDTVPGGNWQGPDAGPYEAVIRDGRVYGRGAADVKGSITGAVLAIKALLSTGAKIPGRVVFAGVTGEEGSTSNGTHELLRNGPIPDMAIVCEPSGLGIYVSQKGSTNFSVGFSGKAAHSSRPELGVNAIDAAARFLLLHHASYGSRVGITVDPLLGPATLVPVGVSGGGRGDTIPDRCSVKLNCRYPSIVHPEEVEAYLKDTAEETSRTAGVGCEVSRETRTVQWRFEDKPSFEALPFTTPLDSPLVTSLVRSITAVRGKEPAIMGATFWSDAGLISGAAGVPAVVFGPGDISVAHAPVEYVEIAQVLDMAKILVHFVLSQAA